MVIVVFLVLLMSVEYGAIICFFICMVRHIFFVHKSKKRAKEILNNSDLGVEEKCLLLENELVRVMSSAFNSCKWEEKLGGMIDTLMKENNLSVNDFCETMEEEENG